MVADPEVGVGLDRLNGVFAEGCPSAAPTWLGSNDETKRRKPIRSIKSECLSEGSEGRFGFRGKNS